YLFFLLLSPPPSISPLFPYTTLFRSALDRQLVLDERIDPLRRRARQFRQRWPAVTEDPRIAVVIGGDRPIQPHRLEQAEQRARRVHFGRILRVVADVLDERVRLGVLTFEARHEKAALTVGVDDERSRTLGRDEREAGVVQDVRVVEEDGAGEPAVADVLGEPAAALLVFGPADLHAARSFAR